VTTPLWTAEELRRTLGADVPPGLSATGVSFDTRTLQAGDLFFAIKGISMDGHRFVARALEQGAAAAVIEAGREGEFAGAGPLIAVSDVLEALNRLGLAARERSGAKIIAVTGSVGKTSTKEMLRAVLSRHGKTHYSEASYNNHWGVPLSLARMPRDCAYGVFEIGMNHMGEIRPLVKMVRPHYALVTHIGPVHLEFFASVEEIADAKAEIFAGLEPGGVAVLSWDSPYFERLKAHALAGGASRIVSFGEIPGADIRAVGIRETPDGSVISAEVFGAPIVYQCSVPGRHMAMNSLAVLAAAREMGIPPAETAEALAHVSAAKGRGERWRLAVGDGAFTLIDESYNANPESVRAALTALGRTPVSGSGRRIAALGPMRELGPGGPALHAELAQTLAELAVDSVYLAGDLMQSLYKVLPEHQKTLWVEQSADLIQPLLNILHPGDVLMVKGSLSTRMGLIVKALKEHYPPAPAD
jgi:UDP-N-acetylmuramoyl-tripeptide--D-alanyl-D-alanine ligase